MKKFLVIAAFLTSGCAADTLQEAATPVQVNDVSSAAHVASMSHPPGSMEFSYHDDRQREAHSEVSGTSLRPGLTAKPRRLLLSP